MQNILDAIQNESPCMQSCCTSSLRLNRMRLEDLEEEGTFRIAKMGEKVAREREGTWGDRAINEDAAGEGEGRVRRRRRRRKGDCDHKTMACVGRLR